jgi:hypothetical protein
MQIKGVLLVASLILFTLITINSANAIFMGTCEGYVFNFTGGIAPGAAVNVTVDGCTSQNCWQTTTSDSGGYYVVANLNLNAFGGVTAYANRSNEYGSNTGNADSFQAAYVNITMCPAPFPPTLTPIADTHNSTLIIHSWTSGSSPYSVFDTWLYEAAEYNATSPQNKTYVDFKIYTWGVKTCLVANPGCCSPYAYDTYDVYNTPPTTPVLIDQTNTLANNVTLYWLNSTDADGDPIYYNFRFNGAPRTNVTSPQNVSGFGFGCHTWQAQACDPWECSSWGTDVFCVTNNPPSPPTLTDQPHTDAASVALTWTSGIDPDNHSTYDEYRFNYSSIITNATSPQVEALTGIQFITWQARTCDIYGACSAWAEDTFIKYECPPCVCPPSAGGGGGGRRTTSGVKYENITLCNESWVCENWSPCVAIASQYKSIWDYEKAGIQVRECADTTNCGTTCTKPATWQFCEPPKKPGIELPILFAIPWWITILIIGLIIGLAACGVYIKKMVSQQNAYQKTTYYKKWVQSLRKGRK